MMGINPLLDSLLVHAQRNKVRTDSSVRYPVNPPVIKAEAGHRAERAYSDSRLNEQSKGPGIQVSLSHAGLKQAPLPSTLTTLNPAAQTIAAILRDFPLQASLSHYLLPAWSESQLMRTPIFSQFMTDFIRRSGLFFESQLAQWYMGDLNLSDLNQARGKRYLKEGSFSYSLLPDYVKMSSMQDRVNYIVRQQLELLSCPMLCFEGKVGESFAMLLLAYLYPEEKPAPETLDFGQNKPTSERVVRWKLVLRFDHFSFGYTEIELTQSEHLEVMIRSPSMIFLEYAHRDMPQMIDALNAIGFSDAAIHREQLENRTSMQDCLERHKMQAEEGKSTQPVESMLDQHYGTLSERIMEQAAEKGAPMPSVEELFPLLMNLDMDRNIPLAAYDAAGYMINWALQQIQHVKF